MDRAEQQKARRIAYFFTRFPFLTETFLQREIRALHLLGVRPDLYSWHGGGTEFDGSSVVRFPKWRLFQLLWRLPAELVGQPAVIGRFLRRLFTTGPRNWLNFWENLYGAGIGVVVASSFRDRRVDHIHAVWASLPAMVAWVVAELTNTPFSIGAHAYDLFEHGGDWFLRDKCQAARFVHTSTAAGKARLETLPFEAAKVLVVRRGLDAFPVCRPLRPVRVPAHIVCVARLVEKKGLPQQLRLYRALRDAGFEFRVRIIGAGPLQQFLQAQIARLGLAGQVALVGAVSLARVWEELQAADVLMHTGVVASTGDRDGLPNVVPEAMAAGVIVVTAPGAGVLEAVADGKTGLVCDLDNSSMWIRSLRRLQTDDAFAEGLRVRARRWVEENFDAVANARLLLARMGGGAL